LTDNDESYFFIATGIHTYMYVIDMH